MLCPSIKLFRYKKSETELPFFLSAIRCGFPSPADEYLESIISLDEVVNARPASTFFARVIGNSLNGIGVYEDDIMVIDKSLTAENGSLVLCLIDGEFNGKILKKDKTGIQLLSPNSNYKPIIIEEFQDFRCWGVVTYVIKNTKNKPHDWNV